MAVGELHNHPDPPLPRVARRLVVHRRMGHACRPARRGCVNEREEQRFPLREGCYGLSLNTLYYLAVDYSIAGFSFHKEGDMNKIHCEPLTVGTGPVPRQTER